MPGVKGRSGGRNAKTAEQHRLEGTFQKCRHGEDGGTAAEPPKGRPTIPTQLQGEALAHWHLTVEHLEAAKTLTIVDGLVLYRYCQLHARAERVEAEIAKLESPFYTDDLGHVKVHPAFTLMRAYDQALRGYLVELGMTPASRARVKPEAPPAPKDEMAEFDEGPT